VRWVSWGRCWWLPNYYGAYASFPCRALAIAIRLTAAGTIAAGVGGNLPGELCPPFLGM
jgi:hypothetical protein